MRVLILGGTLFIGREIAETLLAAGHTVTVLTRGITPDDLPVEVERVRGDRDQGEKGLAALAGRSWDACVDMSGFFPGQVRASVEILRGREGGVGRYVFMSAVAVYGEPERGPVMETHSRIPAMAEDAAELVMETYGAMKVASEDIVTEAFGERGTILRPQSVVGPRDDRGRLHYWVRRAMIGGRMLAPGDGTDHLQVIDVRDVARFALRVVEADIGGVFNLSGPRVTWREFMGMLQPVGEWAWVPAEILAKAGVTFMELPLYRREGEAGSMAALMHVSHDKAMAAGLELTPLEETVAAMREWLRGREWILTLTEEREGEWLGMAGIR